MWTWMWCCCCSVCPDPLTKFTGMSDEVEFLTESEKTALGSTAVLKQWGPVFISTSWLWSFCVEFACATVMQYKTQWVVSKKKKNCKVKLNAFGENNNHYKTKCFVIWMNENFHSRPHSVFIVSTSLNCLCLIRVTAQDFCQRSTTCG